MDDEQQSALVNTLTQDSLKRCFKMWGIEHTEEKINELCINEAMKECFIRNYKYLLTGKYNA